MPTLEDLLSAPSIAAAIEPVVASPGAAQVRSVRVIEDLADMATSPPAALVILSALASEQAGSYRLDMALRMAAAGGVAGIVLTGCTPVAISSTAAAIARRSEIGVFRTREQSDLATLAVAVDRELRGGSDAALERAAVALQAVLDAEAAGRPAPDLVAVAATVLGADLVLELDAGPLFEGWIGVSVPVAGRSELRVAGRTSGAPAEAALRLVCHVVAAAASRSFEAARRAADAPILSRAELLNELLITDAARVEPLVERARAIGLPIDGWQAVIRLELENLAEMFGQDEVGEYELTQGMARLAIDTARAAGGTWYLASGRATLLLVRMERTDPGSKGPAENAAAAARVIARLIGRVARLAIRCGIGGIHSGTAGLRASGAEARAAAGIARTSGRVNVPVSYDALGLRRTLVDWYASESAQGAVDAVLAPLDALGERRSRQAIETLSAYLDSQGSLARSGEVLHLHRNAVAYRMKRILEILNVDPDDPDQRLLLQLACRARTFR